MPQQRLLLKLKAHGIGDGIIDWIEKWLTDRIQRVVVDGEVSNWKSVLSRVPQGLVLGHLLFLIYIHIYMYVCIYIYVYIYIYISMTWTII